MAVIRETERSHQAKGEGREGKPGRARRLRGAGRPAGLEAEERLKATTGSCDGNVQQHRALQASEGFRVICESRGSHPAVTGRDLAAPFQRALVASLRLAKPVKRLLQNLGGSPGSL